MTRRKTVYRNVQDEIEGPDEEDCFLTPSGYLGSKTSASCGGRFIGEFSDDESALRAIKRWQRKHDYWPNIWYVDDHGGHTLWT